MVASSNGRSDGAGGDHALLATGISGISGVGDNDAAAAASADACADADAAVSERREDSIADRNCEQDTSGQVSMQVLGKDGVLLEGIELPMEA